MSKKKTFKPGTFQFRPFTDAKNPEMRAISANATQAAKNSKADSLLRKFSFDKDDEK